MSRDDRRILKGCRDVWVGFGSKARNMSFTFSILQTFAQSINEMKIMRTLGPLKKQWTMQTLLKLSKMSNCPSSKYSKPLYSSIRNHNKLCVTINVPLNTIHH